MSNFKIPKNGNDMMPFNFGPRATNANVSGWYRDVTMIVVPYLTDANILRSIIPEQFSIPEEPVVSIAYACNKDIDWLAGRAYNLISVSVETTFKGTVDQETAAYNLVFWENLTDPILTGRELQGIPKIYADIEDHKLKSGTASSHVSHYNNPILDISISNLTKLDDDIVKTISDSEKNKKTFGYRYIPNVDVTKEPVVAEPILHTSHNFFKEMHLGQGHVDWHSSSWEQNPTQAHIINKLKELPILEYKDAVFIKGATNLFIPEQPSKVLK